MAIWDWNGKRWRARFQWACGVEGTTVTDLNPSIYRHIAMQAQHFIGACERRACPRCRAAISDGRPQPPGHQPVASDGLPLAIDGIRQ